MKCETSLKDGLDKINERKRPGMVIIHQSTCSVCTSLQPKFLASVDINRLNPLFVFISLQDGAEPKDKKWIPDGRYYPRIFFLNLKGEIMLDITNNGENRTYKYYYANEANLVRSMERVLDIYPEPRGVKRR